MHVARSVACLSAHNIARAAAASNHPVATIMPKLDECQCGNNDIAQSVAARQAWIALCTISPAAAMRGSVRARRIADPASSHASSASHSTK